MCRRRARRGCARRPDRYRRPGRGRGRLARGKQARRRADAYGGSAGARHSEPGDRGEKLRQLDQELALVGIQTSSMPGRRIVRIG